MSVSRLFADFNALTREIRSSGDTVVRGKLYDTDLGIACPMGTLLLAPEMKGAETTQLLGSLVRRRAWRVPVNSPEASRLLALTQFEADSTLAARYEEAPWIAMGPCSAGDFDLLEYRKAQIHRETLDPDDPAAPFGDAGPTFTRFLGFLGNRSDKDWSEIRRTHLEEFSEAVALAFDESESFNIVRRDYPPPVVSAAETWTRTVAFRSAWQFIGRAGEPDAHTTEWDVAWVAWCADLARRASVELLAFGVGAKLEGRALRLFGLTFETVSGLNAEQ